MHIKAMATGAFEEICYILWDEAKQAIIVDPGDDAEDILAEVREQELDIAAYVCTHGHADHIHALAELHAVAPAPVAMHALDLAWAFDTVNCIEPHYSVPAKPEVDEFLALDRSADWTFADLFFHCIETPGHTPGSCSLYFPEPGVLISGDTLFKGSCGRTDLPGGDPRRMKESLAKLKSLPPEVRVFPGHGPDSTIGIECATNFFMQSSPSGR